MLLGIRKTYIAHISMVTIDPGSGIFVRRCSLCIGECEGKAYMLGHRDPKLP